MFFDASECDGPRLGLTGCDERRAEMQGLILSLVEKTIVIAVELEAGGRKPR